MKLKPSAPEEIVAKIEYMLAADVILSESDCVFLGSGPIDLLEAAAAA
jgi:hypothetical protein